MNFAGLIFLLIAHFITGRGVLRLINVQLEPLTTFCFSMIIGVPMLSFAPCVLQLMHIPITMASVFFSVAGFAVAFGIPLTINFKRLRFQKITFPKLYEWPFYLVYLVFIIISLWRCFYMPPYSRDMLSGPELLAEYAVREKTMISSVFTTDMTTSNNYFKSPYITCLQIIYKLLVSSFGQVWLSILFLSFTVWIFALVRKRLHPLVACLLLLLFILIPEMFAYTFVILYDYSNMIFFFSAYYFLTRYLGSNKINEFAFSVFLFGIATYIRTETLILIAMIMPLLVFNYYRNKVPLKKAVLRIGIFCLVPFAFYFLNIHVFIRNFIPIPFDLGENLNRDLTNTSAFFQRLDDMNNQLIFSKLGYMFFGYFIYIFCGIFIIDIIWPRKFNRESLFALYGVGVVYFGLGLIGYLLPLADLLNTTKRGMFKAFPLMLLYMANSGLLIRLSEAIKDWEYPKPKPIAQPKQTLKANVNIKTANLKKNKSK